MDGERIRDTKQAFGLLGKRRVMRKKRGAGYYYYPIQLLL
jgi:hypothetical protein